MLFRPGAWPHENSLNSPFNVRAARWYQDHYLMGKQAVSEAWSYSILQERDNTPVMDDNFKKSETHFQYSRYALFESFNHLLSP